METSVLVTVTLHPELPRSPTRRGYPRRWPSWFSDLTVHGVLVSRRCEPRKVFLRVGGVGGILTPSCERSGVQSQCMSSDISPLLSLLNRLFSVPFNFIYVTLESLRFRTCNQDFAFEGYNPFLPFSTQKIHLLTYCPHPSSDCISVVWFWSKMTLPSESSFSVLSS